MCVDEAVANVRKRPLGKCILCTVEGVGVLFGRLICKSISELVSDPLFVVYKAVKDCLLGLVGSDFVKSDLSVLSGVVVSVPQILVGSKVTFREKQISSLSDTVGRIAPNRRISLCSFSEDGEWCELGTWNGLRPTS